MEAAWGAHEALKLLDVEVERKRSGWGELRKLEMMVLWMKNWTDYCYSILLVGAAS